MKEENKLHKVMSNGFKIYPVVKNFKFAICVEDSRNVVYKKNKTIGEYKHTTKTINNALLQTIDYVYNKIINKN